MRITIVGAGNGGCAAACVYARRGHEVTLCKLGTESHEENFKRLQSTCQMDLTGIEGQGPARFQVTRDPQQALEGAETVLIFYVANLHEQVAARIVPHLRDGQMVVLGPGYAGSLLFQRIGAKLNRRPAVVYAELETLPFSSRITAPGVMNVSSRNVRHPLATLPAKGSPQAVSCLEPLLGPCVQKRNVLEVALHNPNLIIHTIGTLMNAALIERSGAGFHMYRDGFTGAIWNLVEQLDAEKMAVMKRIGGTPVSYFEEFVLRTFEDTSIDPLKGFAHYAGEAPGGPSTLNTRYITEDVPIGLGLLASLGSHGGIATPVADGLLRIAAAIHKRDYLGEARTLERIWQGDLDSLIKYVNY